MTDVIDEQRDQPLGELIRTVVIRVIGYDCRHVVSVVEGTYEMIQDDFAGTVRAVGIVFSSLKQTERTHYK